MSKDMSGTILYQACSVMIDRAVTALFDIVWHSLVALGQFTADDLQLQYAISNGQTFVPCPRLYQEQSTPGILGAKSVDDISS